jgi:hypothetical protein
MRNARGITNSLALPQAEPGYFAVSPLPCSAATGGVGGPSNSTCERSEHVTLWDRESHRARHPIGAAAQLMKVELGTWANSPKRTGRNVTPELQ